MSPRKRSSLGGKGCGTSVVGLNSKQRQEAQDVSELTVRRYFDHYLTEVFPKQIKEAIRTHDQNVFSHGGIVRRFARFKYLLMGFAAAGGFGIGAGFDQLFKLLIH